MVTLIVAIALLAATVAGGLFMRQGAEVVDVEDSAEVLEAFLAAATSWDEEWKDHAAPRVVDEFDWSAPFAGHDLTGEALDLQIDYEVFRTDFSDPTPEESHWAKAFVEFTYEYTIFEDTYTASIIQLIWLTRPPLEKQGEEYVHADPRRIKSPDAFGQWKVYVIGVPVHDESSFEEFEWFTTDLVVADKDNLDSYKCSPAIGVLEDMAEAFYDDGEIGSNCLYGTEQSFVGSGEVSPEDIAEVLPPVEYGVESTYPPELMGFREKRENTFSARAPLRQYYLARGGAAYVVTVAAAEDDIGYIYQIIAMQPFEEAQ